MGSRSIIFASALGWRASALVGLGRHAEAGQWFAESIALYEALGDRERAAVERLNLAELDFAAGRVTSALSNIDASLEVVRGRQAAAETVALLNTAAYRVVLGDLNLAYQAARDVLRTTRRLDAPLWRAFALQHLATVTALGGNVRPAARLLGYVDAALEREGVAREPTEVRTFEILRSALNETLVQ